MRPSVFPARTLPTKYLLASIALITSLALFAVSTGVALAPTANAQTFPVLMAVVATSTPSEAPSAKYDPIASNCWLLIQSVYPQLKNTREVHSNSTPAVGVIAFFQYGSTPHYAIITKLENDGFWVRDSNFGGAGYRTHFIEWSNPHLRYFFDPNKGASSS